MIFRDLVPKLEKELTTKEIVVITGMRQVGKTTLLTHLFNRMESKNKAMLDLENPLARKILEEENFDNVWHNLKAAGIYKKQPAYIFIDEIQNLAKAIPLIKYLYDHWGVKFFLTGSSSFYLKNLFSESLSGRKVVYEMYPLTFGEFLRFKGIERAAGKKSGVNYQRLIKLFDEYMEFGGFPAVVLEADADRKRNLLEQIFKSYFEIDVKHLADFRELSKLRDLILLAAGRVGSKIDISKLASELGLGRETVYSYLTFLEQTYFISLVPKFSRSRDRRISGQKKLYLADSGLANLIGRPGRGQIFEQTVWQAIRPGKQICYFARGEREIDFIVDGRTGLEAKITAGRRDEADLIKRAESLGLAEKFIVSYNFSSSERVIVCTDL